MQSKLSNGWGPSFPMEVGVYWFYGYRFGKAGLTKDNEPVLMLVRVVQGGNSMIAIADGQFMYESELEQQHFKKAILPDLPDLDF